MYFYNLYNVKKCYMNMKPMVIAQISQAKNLVQYNSVVAVL